ncbi:nucleotide pyrophosphohydrolase [Carnobacteriaceae bacterium zg-ZUI252]|nr:nucleotide pyrophosphohydrolase [Carnobacteriaceae bacterium zg-ZUI252]
MSIIHVIGLGAGDMNQLPLGVYRHLEAKIKQKETVYLRTKLHPVVDTLVQEGLIIESFDDIYEQFDAFEKVYETIVEKLVALANDNTELTYAVPGHPMVAESVVQQLLKRDDITVNIVGGHSFIDDLAAAVRIDVIDGFQLVDALDFRVEDVVLTQHVMIMQVFNDFVASDVKLSLMKRYPDDYRVALVHAAGTTQQHVDWMPLYEIDRLDGVYNLTTLFVPKMAQDDATASFQTLQHYMAQIAQNDIWLKEQTHESLLPYFKEELQEFEQALKNDDIDNMIEELGDLLWQVLFQTSVAEYDGYFNLEDVLTTLNQKIRRRHPHVFDGVTVNSVKELDALWQKIKKQEKADEIR